MECGFQMSQRKTDVSIALVEIRGKRRPIYDRQIYDRRICDDTRDTFGGLLFALSKRWHPRLGKMAHTRALRCRTTPTRGERVCFKRYITYYESLLKLGWRPEERGSGTTSRFSELPC